MGYLGSALTEEEANLFVAKYNKIDERVCIICFKTFESEGVHNRKCSVCKAREKLNENNQIKFDMPVYKMSGKFKPCHHYRGEVD